MMTKATPAWIRTLFGVAAWTALLCAPVQAQTFTVNSANDAVTNSPACPAAPPAPGDCTLREAIEQANLNPGPDTIAFGGHFDVELYRPLDPVQPLAAVPEPLTIDGGSTGSTVSGPYDCSLPAPGTFAFDLTDPLAVGSSVLRLPFFDVCGLAIKSPVGSPGSLRVGPRRSDGTLPITGAADGIVDLFTAPNATDYEATKYLSSATSAGGSFGLTLSPEPAPGAALTATQTTGAATSNFAPPFLVPFDVVSPRFNGAFATGLTQVRVDFSEPVAVDTLAVGDFQLSMAGLPRTVATIEPSGTSVFLNADSVAPWSYGDAGAISLTSAGAVTDLAGNEISGAPSGRVYGGPGDLGAPVISEYVVSPRTFCTRKGYGCRRTKVKVKFDLSEAATVTFDVVKYKPGSRSRARFRDRLPAGPQSRPLSHRVSGKVIRPGRYFLMAYALDRPRNKSEQVGAFFEIKSPKPKPKPKKKKKKKKR